MLGGELGGCWGGTGGLWSAGGGGTGALWVLWGAMGHCGCYGAASLTPPCPPAPQVLCGAVVGLLPPHTCPPHWPRCCAGPGGGGSPGGVPDAGCPPRLPHGYGPCLVGGPTAAPPQVTFWGPPPCCPSCPLLVLFLSVHLWISWGALMVLAPRHPFCPLLVSSLSVHFGISWCLPSCPHGVPPCRPHVPTGVPLMSLLTSPRCPTICVPP